MSYSKNSNPTLINMLGQALSDRDQECWPDDGDDDYAWMEEDPAEPACEGILLAWHVQAALDNAFLTEQPFELMPSYDKTTPTSLTKELSCEHVFPILKHTASSKNCIPHRGHQRRCHNRCWN